jgi:hypothetical protein
MARVGENLRTSPWIWMRAAMPRMSLEILKKTEKNDLE